MMPQLQDFHRGIPMYTEQEFYCNTWQDMNTRPCFQHQPFQFLLSGSAPTLVHIKHLSYIDM
jgi:hypothetical protein